jgi:alginate O-acetyltransferase complex protein AlgI
MSFTSPEFVLFFIFTLGLMAVAGNVSNQQRVLILFSYLFYLTFGLVGIPAITLIAFVDYNVGRKLCATEEYQARNKWLLLSLSTNIGLLFIFKYAAPFVEALNLPQNLISAHITILHSEHLTPVGISYFTFASMSYVMDVYYQRTDATNNFSEYLSYLLYFPKLIAGPIVRAVTLLPQLKKSFSITAQDFETGAAYFLVGAVKKLVIADRLVGHIGLILGAPHEYDAFTLLQGVLGYSVQIYLDFSGYSDMAIGCARMMGIQFPQNFMMPYSSVSIVEFWRRWHITLSTWLRDYIFLPLELSSRDAKNRNLRTSRNIVITMLVCGLWHGANWNFVLWGGLHGIALATNLVYGNLRRRRQNGSAHWIGTAASRALTLSTVMAGWVFFGTNTPTRALQYFGRLLTWRSDGIALGSPYILPLVCIVVLAHVFINKDRNLVEELPTFAVPTRIFAYSILLLALTTLVATDTVPFVYVQF